MLQQGERRIRASDSSSALQQYDDVDEEERIGRRVHFSGKVPFLTPFSEDGEVHEVLQWNPSRRFTEMAATAADEVASRRRRRSYIDGTALPFTSSSGTWISFRRFTWGATDDYFEVSDVPQVIYPSGPYYCNQSPTRSFSSASLASLELGTIQQQRLNRAAGTGYSTQAMDFANSGAPRRRHWRVRLCDVRAVSRYCFSTPVELAFTKHGLLVDQEQLQRASISLPQWRYSLWGPVGLEIELQGNIVLYLVFCVPEAADLIEGRIQQVLQTNQAATGTLFPPGMPMGSSSSGNVFHDGDRSRLSQINGKPSMASTAHNTGTSPTPAAHPVSSQNTTTALSSGVISSTDTSVNTSAVLARLPSGGSIQLRPYDEGKPHSHRYYIIPSRHSRKAPAADTSTRKLLTFPQLVYLSRHRTCVVHRVRHALSRDIDPCVTIDLRATTVTSLSSTGRLFLIETLLNGGDAKDYSRVASVMKVMTQMEGGKLMPRLQLRIEAEAKSVEEKERWLEWMQARGALIRRLADTHAAANPIHETTIFYESPIKVSGQRAPLTVGDAAAAGQSSGNRPQSDDSPPPNGTTPNRLTDVPHSDTSVIGTESGSPSPMRAHPANTAPPSPSSPDPHYESRASACQLQGGEPSASLRTPTIPEPKKNGLAQAARQDDVPQAEHNFSSESPELSLIATAASPFPVVPAPKQRISCAVESATDVSAHQQFEEAVRNYTLQDTESSDLSISVDASANKGGSATATGKSTKKSGSSVHTSGRDIAAACGDVGEAWRRYAVLSSNESSLMSSCAEPSGTLNTPTFTAGTIKFLAADSTTSQNRAVRSEVAPRHDVDSSSAAFPHYSGQSLDIPSVRVSPSSLSNAKTANIEPMDSVPALAVPSSRNGRLWVRDPSADSSSSSPPSSSSLPMATMETFSTVPLDPRLLEFMQCDVELKERLAKLLPPVKGTVLSSLRSSGAQPSTSGSDEEEASVKSKNTPCVPLGGLSQAPPPLKRESYFAEDSSAVERSHAKTKLLKPPVVPLAQ